MSKFLRRILGYRERARVVAPGTAPPASASVEVRETNSGRVVGPKWSRALSPTGRGSFELRPRAREGHSRVSWLSVSDLKELPDAEWPIDG
jgi:hypothetical protein